MPRHRLTERVEGVYFGSPEQADALQKAENNLNKAEQILRQEMMEKKRQKQQEQK
jgi:hypothetical protein